MWPCDRDLVTRAFLREKLSQPQFFKDLTRKQLFRGVLFVQVQYFKTGIRYGLEILRQHGKRIKT